MKASGVFTVLLLLLALSISTTSCVKEVEDNAKPYIIVLGANPTYVRLNGTFQDTGVMVTDNYGVFKVWSDTSQLNLKQAGRYKVLYYAEDFAGNVGTAERTVIVRIEGANLKGTWNGTRTFPYPSGQQTSFSDSLVKPSTRKIYFTNFGGIYPAEIRADILGALGDTLALAKQILYTQDSSTFYLSGLGTIAHDGQSFTIYYHLIQINPSGSDTLAGEIKYLKPSR
ncbi:MAG: immunoglobulin-like domain-containing protein [Bacteroidales bacterium]